MGWYREKFDELGATERWKEVDTGALLAFPDRRKREHSLLDAISALPAGTAVSAAIDVSPEGSVFAVLRQLQLQPIPGKEQIQPLLGVLAPTLIPGSKLALSRSPDKTASPMTIVPEWLSLPEGSKRPQPFVGDNANALAIPRPPATWPWDISRALATLAANGGGVLNLTVKNLERSARIVRTVASLRDELVAAAYSHPDERLIIAGQAHCRSLLDDPAMLGFEVSITTDRVSETICNLVAMAIFGSLADQSPGDEGDDDLRLIAGSRQVPDRIVPHRDEVASLAGSVNGGGLDEERAWHIGSTGSGVPVSLSNADRARHVYVIGATGTGKSTLLSSLIRQDAAAGEGIILLDPHGDLAEEAAAAMPAERVGDLIYADAADLAGQFAVGLLPSNSDGASFEIAADMLISICKNDLYAEAKDAFGPIFESYFRSALALLVAAEPNERRLANFPRVFEDRVFRDRLLEACTAPDVVSFWRKTALRASGEIDLTNVTPYITGKLTRFITTRHARAMFPAGGRCLDFGEIMKQGKILILRCPKGALGEGLVELAMSACLMKIRAAVMARVASRVRRPVRLYIDEFQNCKGTSLQTLLAEGRKFGVSLVLANQSLGQIGGTTNRSIGAATLANVGNLVTFRLGATDAMQLSPWMEEPEQWRELCRLADFTMNARLLVNGRPTNFYGLGGPAPERAHVIGDRPPKPSH